MGLGAPWQFYGRQVGMMDPVDTTGEGYSDLRKGWEIASSQVWKGVVQYVSRGPIAQWLEQPAHKKCAHVLLKLLLRECSVTEANVTKAQPYPTSERKRGQ